MSEVFIIISTCVTENMYIEYSKAIQHNLMFISDNRPKINKPNIYNYTNNALLIQSGFTGLHSKHKITAWDKAFYHIKQLQDQGMTYTNYWIIEDDCYINHNEFQKFVDTYQSNVVDLLCFGWKHPFITHKSWVHWNKRFLSGQPGGETYFQEADTCSTINQMIRISNNCVNEIFKFKEKYNRFIFHELFLMSIANAMMLTSQVINIETVHLAALKSSSLLYNKYPNQPPNHIISELERLRYVALHPFKRWYNHIGISM